MSVFFLKSSLSVSLTLLVAWSPAVVRAELIIDDFDDPAEVVTPAMIDQFVETPGVGDLNARRSIRIAGSRAEPTGRIDVNAGGSSAFVAELNELNPTSSTGLKIVSVQSNYGFTLPGQPLSSVDVTEGGRNDAFFFDFKLLQAGVVPRYLRVILSDESASYTSYLTMLPLRDEGHTLTMPFSSFGLRGGGPGLPDFSKVRSFHVELRVLESVNGPDDLRFSMELDRIRVGRIPEPACSSLAILELAVVARMRRAGRRSRLRRRRSDDLQETTAGNCCGLRRA